MNRPSIALCCIAKNEEKHIQRFIDSFKPYVDNIYLTDTGSTDSTVEIAKKNGCIVSNFDWIGDFSAARNYNFSQVKNEEFILWGDL